MSSRAAWLGWIIRGWDALKGSPGRFYRQPAWPPKTPENQKQMRDQVASSHVRTAGPPGSHSPLWEKMVGRCSDTSPGCWWGWRRPGKYAPVQEPALCRQRQQESVAASLRGSRDCSGREHCPPGPGLELKEEGSSVPAAGAGRDRGTQEARLSG